MIYDSEFKKLLTSISVFVFPKNTESRLAEKCTHRPDLIFQQARKIWSGNRRRERGQHGPPPTQRLLITPPILRQILPVLLAVPSHHDKAMLWAAASACFFGFFRAGEITVPSASAFDPLVHLAWGDVAIIIIIIKFHGKHHNRCIKFEHIISASV